MGKFFRFIGEVLVVLFQTFGALLLSFGWIVPAWLSLASVLAYLRCQAQQQVCSFPHLNFSAQAGLVAGVWLGIVLYVLLMMKFRGK